MLQAQGTAAHTIIAPPQSRSSDLDTIAPLLEGVPLAAVANMPLQTQSEPTAGAAGSAARSANIAPPLYPVPSIQPSRVYATILQKWEGYVLAVGEGTFSARLMTKQGDNAGEEFVAEIYLDEIDAEDRLLLAPGAVFYWSIGYYERPSGRMRFSSIRMRRLPQWSAADLARAQKTAEELSRLLDGAVTD